MLKKISQRSENQTHSRFTQRQNQKAVNTNTSVNTICLKQKQQWRLLKPQISKKISNRGRHRLYAETWNRSFLTDKKSI